MNKRQADYDEVTLRLPKDVDATPLLAFVQAMGWSEYLQQTRPAPDYSTMPGQFAKDEQVSRIRKAMASPVSYPQQEVRRMAQNW